MGTHHSETPMTTPPHRKHRYHSPWKRGLYSVVLVAGVMGVGTMGLHRLEGLSYLEAFYFMSMIATAQGANWEPATPAGKLFFAGMAFISVGTVVAALGFLFGPFFGQLWHLGVKTIEHDAQQLTRHNRTDDDP